MDTRQLTAQLITWFEALGFSRHVAVMLVVFMTLVALAILFMLVIGGLTLLIRRFTSWKDFPGYSLTSSEQDKWTLESARDYLLRHDPGFQHEQASFELMRRRSKAREAGIGPGDPRYPDIWDVIGEEPPVPLEHRTAKLKARRAMALMS